MSALFILLSVIIAGMNIINYNSVINEADSILSILSKNKGNFPDNGKYPNQKITHNRYAEIPFESRFFSIVLNYSNEIVSTDISKISSVDNVTAIEYAEKILEKNDNNDFIDRFRYIRYSEPYGSRVIFLDCGRLLDSFYKFLATSIGMALAGYIIVFFVILFFSERIIRPIAESYEKQKQFITDAGHEIKTPLTIINANVDILEMELGENESLTDIKQQTKRLKSLTNDLVMLARMEESENNIQKIEFPISEIIADTAHPFKTLALQQDKKFVCDIEPLLSLTGNDKTIGQLVTILLDNAFKYSPTGGQIHLKLYKHSKTLILTLYNDTVSEIRQEHLLYIFDRFYRTDFSRNSETGGHGIGLSVAKAIVNAHNGKIHASSPNNQSFQIMVTLPI